MKKYILIISLYIPYQIYYSYWFFIDIHNKFKNKIKNEIIKN